MCRDFRFRALTIFALTVACVALSPSHTFAQHHQFKLSPLVAKLLEDKTLSETQRRRLAIFHGQWNMLDEHTLTEEGQIAVHRFDLSAKVLSNPAVPAMLRAEAALYRGEAQRVIDLLTDDRSAQAAVLRGRAHWQLGQFDQAINQLKPWRQTLAKDAIDDPAELVAAAHSLAMLALLEGRPSHDYKLAMNLFAKAHQEIDRLYWPAMLGEAQLLYDKDNSREAVKASLHTLALNPRCGPAWYLLGRIGVDGYNFEQAEKAIDQLRKINKQHLLADQLAIHMYLRQGDAAAADRSAQTALARYPKNRQLLALAAAAKALSYDEAALAEALKAYDAHSPRGALAHFNVGIYLGGARQYQSGEAHLRAAIKRLPNWPLPRLELGMLLMQSGEEDEALTELRLAAELDPFHRRARNQLQLAQDLRQFEQIRTEHFIIKYRKGIDEALAREMPQPLERIYDDITGVYGYKPPRPTIIEILPDEQHLAVRIIGMPEIWTIAASTGDVIAITPPREGPGQHGSFDWENVIRHEFVHTVTLNQTRYRIPHWFTEACAVSQESNGREYDTCRLLAAALYDDELFELDQINWGFVRPKKPHHRGLAYAQAHWMVQYITQTYGHDAIVAMLRLFGTGTSNSEAIEQVTQRSADTFMTEFRAWAFQQIELWGLKRTSDDPNIESLLSGSGDDLPHLLDALLQQYPDHPDLLLVRAQRAVATDDYADARAAVLRYAAARPVDPWASRALVQLALEHDRTEDLLGPLEHVDQIDVRSGKWAFQLAKIHRSGERFDAASDAMARAVYREPYNAEYRELAAAIALQRSDTDAALRHIYAMTVLEPDRAVQWVRLAAIYDRLGEPEQARQAAEKARQLDPNAPVDRFLTEK